ncbi:MAG: hypothetical protein A2X61_05300 [Ignavibacteria bacterium GWB2_35_12]|nr:MAG: hypothetical protein A2X63_09365 [Ignavibacteria bacterium GWA2_35_8]OGU42143.1 MAG: hypothetical protein A2X61_05300 [Ignavibacteria bacterium GWB2_35_12]OGU96539.1 MAG: hypothetical protein A2220_02040 [Ignavibacteria bacterium RIFOXYA2_FULL_35_10]OGV19860.1 MAG: hypothetical protein A2475_01925 [Ignavibacteria bacterium RIFOXYC2_FULL_35_21]
MKPGIYFDNLSDINKIITENGFPAIESEHVYYIGFNYASNHFPFPFYHIPNIFISLDVRIPFERTIENGNKSTSLKTYSFFLELEGFHDLINNIAIYPIIGLGCSITHLDLRKDSLIEFKDFLSNPGNSRFTKFNLLLNLGGGMDYKVNLAEDYMKKINLLFGLNIRYSLNLDVLGLYDKRWTSAGQYIDGLPEYHAPGLSIEMKVGIEKLEKIKKSN